MSTDYTALKTEIMKTGVPGLIADAIARSHRMVIQDAAYAATVTPDFKYARSGRLVVRIAAMTNDMTIANPIHSVNNNVIPVGAELKIVLLQDATGGRSITWGSNYLKATDGSGTANQRGATVYVYDGSKFIQISPPLTWY